MKNAALVITFCEGQSPVNGENRCLKDNKEHRTDQKQRQNFT